MTIVEAPVIRIGTLELTTAVGFDIGLFVLVSGALVALIRQLTGLVDDGVQDAEGER